MEYFYANAGREYGKVLEKKIVYRLDFGWLRSQPSLTWRQGVEHLPVNRAHITPLKIDRLLEEENDDMAPALSFGAWSLIHPDTCLICRRRRRCRRHHHRRRIINAS